MSTISTPLRYRLTPVYLDKLRDYASQRRWSVAMATQDIIERFLDGHQDTPEPVAVPSQHDAPPRGLAPIEMPAATMGPIHDADRLLAVFLATIAEHGTDVPHERRRTVPVKVVRDAFNATRPDKTAKANNDAWNRGIGRLIERGAVSWNRITDQLWRPIPG